MTAPTHIAFAEFVYLLLLTTAGVAVNAANALVVAVASIAADIDTGSSLVGKMVPAVSLKIERTFGHRTLTHSALFVAALAVAALPLLSASKDFYACLVIGYGTHPFLDTMNVAGVRLFYPFARVRCVFPFDVGAPGRFRTPTGSGMDRALGALFLAACIPTFVISQQGHERFIRTTQRTIESAVRDYNELSLTHRVVVELTARNLFTKESISGRYEIAGALDERTLLFRDDQGLLHSIGRAYEAEYCAESAVCYRADPVRTVIRSLELENQMLGSVADELEPGARVYILGELVMRDVLELSARPERFAPVTGSGRIARLRYATMDDLHRCGLAELVVARGRVILRSELPARLDAAQSGRDSADGFALLSIRCPHAQKLEIAASIGDTVEPGQILARVRPDTAQRLAGELAAAERAAVADRSHSRLSSYDVQVQNLREEVVADSLEVVRLTQLYREGFVPGVKLLEAERAYQQAKDRRRLANGRRELLLTTISLRARSDSLKARSDVPEAIRVVRCEYRGVIHDIRRSVQGAVVELTFVVRKV